MEKETCECGHENPHGTILCESCGKPLVDEQSNELLNMRYEGSARRSQTYKKTIIDKIWNFFSSVKVGVWIIVLVLVASAIGTIFPQEMYIPPTVSPADYYEEQYGFLGKLYYELGFHQLYSSWWFILLLAALGTSIIIASLDRFIPLYRALKNQRVIRHEHFIKRQRIVSVTETDHPGDIIEKAKQKLKEKRYNVREENGHLLAEKNRFSRWGAYVNHTGIIIFLIGSMLRFFPGMYVDEALWLREGETKAVPGTNGEYYLKNNEFIFEVYGEGEEDNRFQEAIESSEAGIVAKTFQTNATLYRRVGEAIPGTEPELEKVKDYAIRVNEPLKMDGYSVYQLDYRLNELQSMTFHLEKKDSGEQFGSFTVDLLNPKETYDLGNGYRVEVMDYFPDFEFNEQGEPTTKSKIPNNPAFIFKMITPETPDGEVSFVAIRSNLEPLGENQYKLSFAGIETTSATGLSIKKDRTLWILIVGGTIFMIGLVQGMYWHHRRIWLHPKEGTVWMAGHTNKGWYGMKKEMDQLAEAIGLSQPVDQAEERKSTS